MSDSRIVRLAIPNLFFEGRNSVYVIRSEPLTLIDTGIATDRAFEALVEGLAECGVRVGDIRRVILTHKHIDHIGNAWRIQQASGAEILIHKAEIAAVNDVDPSSSRFRELARQRLEEWNVPKSLIDDRTTSKPHHRWKIESAEARPFEGGQTIEQEGGDFEVLHTPGHTLGSVCLRSGSILLTGDHVLPGISPNVGGGDLNNRGMLKHFRASLGATRELGTDELLVLPGHGKPFYGLTARCDELLDHHDQRLAAIVDILKDLGPMTVFGTGGKAVW